MSPKLPRTSGQKIITTLTKKGYSITRQRGSHVIMRNGEGIVVSVPLHKELKSGTLKNILRTTHILVEDLIKVL